VRKLPAQGTHQQDATVLTTGQHTPEAEFAALRLVRNPSSDPAVAHTQTGFTMWRLRLPPGGVDLLPSEADTAQDPRENMWKLLYRVRAEIDLIFFVGLANPIVRARSGFSRTTLGQPEHDLAGW
jgi:hypothetical protein